MGELEVHALRVLADADEPLLAREVAAKMYGTTVRDAIQTGRSVTVAKKLLTLASGAYGYVMRDYPRGTTLTAYAITERGLSVLRTNAT